MLWEGIRMTADMLLSVAPKHLASLDQICKEFGRSRETVLGWARRGAPIAYEGRKYCAEYNTLMKWLVLQSRMEKESNRGIHIQQE